MTIVIPAAQWAEIASLAVQAALQARPIRARRQYRVAQNDEPERSLAQCVLERRAELRELLRRAVPVITKGEAS